MKLRALIAFLLLATAASAQPPVSRGNLVLIGGGEKPVAAMKKFIELAGGPQAPIVVVPTASSEPDAAEYYVKLFKDDYGCTDVTALDIKSKADARRPQYVAAAARARGVFFGGGDQVRILVALEHSPVLDAIRNAWLHGAAIGGTSAGTACQSPMMITGEGDFAVIQSRSVEIWDGLGFTPGVVVDQHFIARQRENRLISVILEHPDQLGVGIDEDTAVWIRPDDTFEVIGLHSVMVLDARGCSVNRKALESGKDLLGVHGMRVHILLEGEVFDIKKGSVVAGRQAATTKAGEPSR